MWLKLHPIFILNGYFPLLFLIVMIDFQAYLSNGEFEAVLGMKKEAFYKLPKWKQDMQKKKADLF